MSTLTLDYLDAIAHLPVGGTLTLNDVSWEDYEQLLEDRGDRAAVRVSYDHGRLKIMSPTSGREGYGRSVSRLGSVLADALDLIVEDYGSTTYKQKWLQQGAEPDTCFYVQNAAQIIGVRRLDLEKDPPPDVVVEIDLSHNSQEQFAIYAGMKVPEFWRYDGEQARIYRLQGQDYQEVSHSLAFPILTSAALTQFLDQTKTAGQTAALKSFRAWLHEAKS